MAAELRRLASANRSDVAALKTHIVELQKGLTTQLKQEISASSTKQSQLKQQESQIESLQHKLELATKNLKILLPKYKSLTVKYTQCKRELDEAQATTGSGTSTDTTPTSTEVADAAQNLQAKVSHLEEEKQRLENELQVLQQAEHKVLQEQKQELATSQLTIVQRDERIAEISQQLTAFENDWENDRKDLRARLEAERQHRQESLAVADGQKTAIAELERKLVENQKQVEEARLHFDTEETAARRENEILQERLSVVEVELNAELSELAQYESQQKDQEGVLLDVSSKLKSAQEAVDAKVRDAQSAQMRIEELSTELESLKRLHESSQTSGEQSQEELLEQLRAARQQWSDTNAELDDAKLNENAIQRCLDDEKQLFANYRLREDQEAEQHRRLLRETQDEVAALSGELDEAKVASAAKLTEVSSQLEAEHCNVSSEFAEQLETMKQALEVAHHDLEQRQASVTLKVSDLESSLAQAQVAQRAAQDELAESERSAKNEQERLCAKHEAALHALEEAAVQARSEASEARASASKLEEGKLEALTTEIDDLAKKLEVESRAVLETRNDRDNLQQQWESLHEETAAMSIELERECGIRTELTTKLSIADEEIERSKDRLSKAEANISHDYATEINALKTTSEQALNTLHAVEADAARNRRSLEEQLREQADEHELSASTHLAAQKALQEHVATAENALAVATGKLLRVEDMASQKDQLAHSVQEEIAALEQKLSSAEQATAAAHEVAAQLEGDHVAKETELIQSLQSEVLQLREHEREMEQALSAAVTSRGSALSNIGEYEARVEKQRNEMVAVQAIARSEASAHHQEMECLASELQSARKANIDATEENEVLQSRQSEELHTLRAEMQEELQSKVHILETNSESKLFEQEQHFRQLIEGEAATAAKQRAEASVRAEAALASALQESEKIHSRQLEAAVEQFELQRQELVHELNSTRQDRDETKEANAALQTSVAQLTKAMPDVSAVDDDKETQSKYLAEVTAAQTQAESEAQELTERLTELQQSEANLNNRLLASEQAAQSAAAEARSRYDAVVAKLKATYEMSVALKAKNERLMAERAQANELQKATAASLRGQVNVERVVEDHALLERENQELENTLDNLQNVHGSTELRLKVPLNQCWLNFENLVHDS